MLEQLLDRKYRLGGGEGGAKKFFNKKKLILHE